MAGNSGQAGDRQQAGSADAQATRLNGEPGPPAPGTSAPPPLPTGATQKGFDGWETAAGLKKVAETTR
ncbi:hypothetical protein ACFQ7Z_24875 [Streptomyces virginiae]|uniref:hypothetical protein n=1 Tax=Streptomyces virginiae TaxID=1961 RepID=UPI0036905E23